MKQSISGLWLMSIMVVFIAIFIAFVCIQLSYSHAYQLKSDMITAIEEYQGMNNTSMDKIDEIIEKYGYIADGICHIDEGHIVYGVIDGVAVLANNHKNERFQYCVSVEMKTKDSKTLGGSLDRYYYTVQVFFGFELPGLGDIYTFKVYGESNAIMYPNEKIFNSSQIYVT